MSHSSSDRSGPTLARTPGLTALVIYYGVGDMLGSGIYALVGKVAGGMGNAIWLAFLASMVAALLTGLSHGLPGVRAAGAAHITHRAFNHPFLSFLTGLAVMTSGLTSRLAQHSGDLPMLPTSSPESLGFDSERLNRIPVLLEEACARQEFGGAAYLIARHGSIVFQGAVGQRNDDPPFPMTLDTIFDLASITKPVATATTALCLLEQGAFHLLQEARGFFPEKSLDHLEGVTLFHLLTHTSGLPAYQDFYRTGQGREHLVSGILSLELTQPPGTKYTYSCLGFILLQAVMERLTGETLDILAHRFVFEPLGMQDTVYCPPEQWHNRIATAGVCPWRERKLLGEVHDPNAAAQGGVSGNAGLFSNASDLAVFAQMMLQGGALHGRRILGPLTARQASENQIDPHIGGTSLGWFTHPNPMLPRGDLLSKRSFGHTGFTGTALLIDPEYELIAILLTNRLVYEPEGTGFFTTRRKFFNLVAASLRV